MDITSRDIFLDFETRSRAPLAGKSGVGAWRYSLDPSTKVLCLAYAFGEDEPSIWIEGQPPPRPLMSAIEAGRKVHGWNSMSFERAIFHNVCVPKLGWVEPHPEQYHDTMLDALTLALPAKLEDCCKALGTYEQKMGEGKKLIDLLCKPIATGKKKGQFREREEYVKDYAQLYVYCKQDVRTERDVYKKLPYTLTGKEREFCLLVMRMNERGLPIDIGLVDAIIEALALEADRLSTEFSSLTGIDRPTKRAQFKDWLLSQGIELPDMQAATLEGLDFSKFTPLVREAMSCYKDGNNASTAKFTKIKEMLCPDGTVKNNLIFNKASTGRLAGAGFQAQNLPKSKAKSPKFIKDCFVDRDYLFLQLYCGIQNAAKMMIRPIIKAPAGMKLMGGDLKQIEARGAPWICGEWDLLDNFRKNIDLYKATAARMYNSIVDMIDKEERQLGKVAVLLGQFGGGYRAVLRGCKKHKLEMSDIAAKRLITAFRKSRPKLTAMWENFGEAAMTACEEGGRVYVQDTRNLVYFEREGLFLFMYLPSGRRLSFYSPEVREEPFFGRMQENVTAMWVDNTPGGNHKWARRVVTGPSFFQSAVQASCRDILFEGHMEVERRGYPLNLSVHDEGISLVPDDPAYNLKDYEEAMTMPNSWCPEMPIGSDCWEAYHYDKK
jgi:DNA polymerase